MNYILKNENAVYYECGFSCDNEIFLKLGDEKFFITDSRYALEAEEKIKNALVLESKDLNKTARELLRKNKIKKIIYDPKDWSVEDFKKISEKVKTNFKPDPSFSQKKRVIKTKEEIELIKKAVKIAKEGFEEFSAFLKEKGENLSERELHFELIKILTKKGEFDLSFSPIVAINENAAKPHALASKKALKNGDLILIDAGVKYKRYCSDRTRTAEFSDHITFQKEQRFSDKKKQKIYDTVLKAQEAAVRKVKPGVKACEIDKAAREVIEKAGFGKYFVHSTGHGVGLDIHELPTISFKNQETVIEENMIFTIEPGIYLGKEFGVRIEDMVAVTKDGCEIL